MPRRDGSGPNGMGSRTGRGLGVCTGVNAPGFGGFGPGYGRRMRSRNGMGLGQGFRGGRGWNGGNFGGGRAWTPTPDYAAVYPDTRASLEERAAFLESELASIKQRMDQLSEEDADQA